MSRLLTRIICRDNFNYELHIDILCAVFCRITWSRLDASSWFEEFWWFVTSSLWFRPSTSPYTRKMEERHTTTCYWELWRQASRIGMIYLFIYKQKHNRLESFNLKCASDLYTDWPVYHDHVRVLGKLTMISWWKRLGADWQIIINYFYFEVTEQYQNEE